MTRCILLFCILLGVITGLAQTAAKSGTSATKRIDLNEYDRLRGNTNYVILDVRSPAEFEKGRIPRAINIDISSTRFADKVGALDTNKTYLVNCAVGMRSARACKKMEGMGFTHLYDLEGGFDAWKKAGKPVEK